jgi:hypothetical protein
VIQQSWTAECEVLHTILPSRPLTLLQIPKLTEVSWKYGVVPTGIPHSEIHIYPLSVINWVWTHVTCTVATHQGVNSILRIHSTRFFNTPTILCHKFTTQMHELEA